MKKEIISVMVVIAMLLSVVPMMGSADDDQIEVTQPEVGTTELLGGGDYVHIKIGNNSDFGVIYGTEEHPNSIVIFSRVTKYVGTVEAYDTNGAKIGERTLRVTNIFAHRLNAFVEFNDSNGNGIFDYTGIIPYDYEPMEHVYKMVSLRTAWERSNITEEKNGNMSTWTFSLTAHNLTYISPNGSQMDTNDTLDTVQFTFHLSAERVYVNATKMPHFKLTIDTHRVGRNGERYRVMKMERSYDTVSGWMMKAHAKYDQYIEGWDFNPSNQNPMLLLRFKSIFMHMVSKREALWIRHAAMNRIGANGTARFSTDSGNMSLNESNSMDNSTAYRMRAMHLKRRYIDIDDSWERVGRFTWVNNVTVDGNETQMHAQIQGGMREIFISNDQIFVGFGVIGGLVYPAGEKIYHDPEISVEAFTDMGSAAQPIGPRIPLGTILTISLLGAIAVVIVGSAIYIKKKKRSKEFEELAESALPDEEKQ